MSDDTAPLEGQRRVEDAERATGRLGVVRRSLKQAKRAERADKLVTGWNRSHVDRAQRRLRDRDGARRVCWRSRLVLLLIASLINGVARWSAGAQARGQLAGTLSEQDRQAQENVLVIGDENGKAVGLPRDARRRGRQAGLRHRDSRRRVHRSARAGLRAGRGELPGRCRRLARGHLELPDGAVPELHRRARAGLPRPAEEPAGQRASRGAITKTNLTDEQRAQLSATLVVDTRQERGVRSAAGQADQARQSDVLRAAACGGGRPAQGVVGCGSEQGGPGDARHRLQRCGQAGHRRRRGTGSSSAAASASSTRRTPTASTTRRRPWSSSAVPWRRARRWSRFLGPATVKEKRTDEDVSDIVVIIGKDYKPSK